MRLRRTWNKTPAHVVFLGTFIRPRLPDAHPEYSDEHWQGMLGEPTRAAIADFIQYGVVRRSGLPLRMDHKFTVGELRQMLRDRALDHTGNKPKLIMRLIKEDIEGMWALVADVELLQLTEYGEKELERHVPKTLRDAKEKKLSPKVITFILGAAAWLIQTLAEEGLLGDIVWEWIKQAIEIFPRLAPKTTREDTIGIEWCKVPAGDFWYGENDTKKRIYLPTFHISKHPITNAQYERFCRTTGQEKPRHWEDGRIPSGKANHPVVHVSWDDATAFCRWATRVEDKPVALPTEEQWEKAARGTDGRKYPWGNDWKENHCNSYEAKNRGTMAVGTYSPRGDSPYGCVDMAGNVWEWADSWYDETRRRYRVLRGGSWGLNRAYARAASRFSYHPARDDFFGFRVVVRRPPSHDP